MALADLKRAPKDKEDEAQAYGPGDQSDYPYGVCLHLDNDELEKLGIDKLPEVGDEFHIRAIGKVTSVSSSDSNGGSRKCVDIQIEMMEARHETEEPGESDSVMEEEAEDAEAGAVGGKAKTMLHNSYRGRT